MPKTVAKPCDSRLESAVELHSLCEPFYSSLISMQAK